MITRREALVASVAATALGTSLFADDTSLFADDKDKK